MTLARRLLLATLLSLPLQGLLPVGIRGQVAGGRAVPGQAVAGRVTEAGTDDAVEGAFVALLDPSDGRRGGALTGADGSFAIPVVAPGHYRLRVERIGYRSVESEAFPVAAGEMVRRDLEVPTEAISLEGIQVEGARRCDLRADEAAAAARLWEEARKALAVATWAEDAGFRYQVTTFSRRVGLSGPLDERPREERTAWVGETFRSLDPDSLAAGGYVVREGDRHVYHGPDARVLLSDAFLETHCFRPERAGGRLGLAFEPAPGRDLPDVEGTLWFAPGGAALEEVEFRYTGLPPGTSHPSAGGRVRFERLPGGAWLVREWTLRMPVVGEERGFGGRAETRVVGFLEQGGRVTDLRAAAPGDGDGDSEGGGSGAGGGGAAADPVAGDIAADGRPPETLARERCLDMEGRGAAAVAGWTRGPGEEAPVGGAAVEVRWAGTVSSATAFAALAAATSATATTATSAASPPEHGIRVASDGQGRFVACGVPAGRTLRVRILSATDGSWVEVAPLEPGAVGRVDLTAPGVGGG